MSKIVCLTGGIGSGKTTVAKLFQAQGIPVYISDQRAKEIMDSKEVVFQIAQLFDTSVVVDGVLDRVKIRSLVFQDKALLDRLNAVVHPAVAADFKSWVAQHADHRFLIKESAILFETKTHSSCDTIILVTAPEELRIQRVVQRDGVSRADVLKIINQQMPENEKGKLSDFIIKNIDIKEVEKEVLIIIRDFLS